MKLNKLLILPVLFIFSCNKQNDTENNFLTKEELTEGWQLLFDGRTLEGWHLYNMPADSLSSSAWKVEDGNIVYTYNNNHVIHEDLVTDRDFENYDFRFEWKIAPEGNSGVFINVTEAPEIPTAWASGPEYQLLDSLHIDHQFSPKKRSGVLFNLTEQITPVPAKPAGEWNQSRIIQKDGVVEFYLNDILTTKEDFNSPEWLELISHSGFANFPDFGRTTHGKISLQKWQNIVSFRNLKIKEL